SSRSPGSDRTQWQINDLFDLRLASFGWQHLVIAVGVVHLDVVITQDGLFLGYSLFRCSFGFGLGSRWRTGITIVFVIIIIEEHLAYTLLLWCSLGLRGCFLDGLGRCFGFAVCTKEQRDVLTDAWLLCYGLAD